MSSFFNDLKDIRLTVMESLPEIAQMNNLSGWVSGDDIPDINGLINEVTELREKIKDLEKDNNQLRMNKSRESNTNNYQELIQLLESIKVKVPENVSKQSAEMELTLLQLYKNSSDYIITGITNAFGVSDGESFLYHNVCPKLQIHGLVENEKVTGVKYRRFAMTKKGTEFLAYLQKQKILKV